MKYLCAIALFATVILLGGCSRLALFNAFVPKDQGSQLVVSGIAYGTDDRQKLDIYLPEKQARSKVVVFVYGGSWDSGSRSEYAFVGRALASRGFVTIIADYRLVPDHLYPAFVEDTAKATAWTHSHIREYGGDPENLYLVGHSAGAYNVMMIALAPKFLEKEGKTTDIVKGVVGLSGPYDFLPLDVAATKAAFAETPNLSATQPVYWAGIGRKPPVFLATGDADETVVPRNTKSLARSLRRSGNFVEDVYYPGIDHAGTLLAISKPLRNKAPVLDDITAFLNQN